MANDIEENKSELFVVGVGASAGGLDALTKFLGKFNKDNSKFCVVIAMHLSPDHKSELTAILAKRCKWSVVTVDDNIELEAGNIYVTPHNSDLHIEDNHLKLDSLPEKHSSAPSVNKFLISLAEGKKQKAIGVILSGFGNDGSEGISSIKKHGGLSIVQLPKTAVHEGMPSSAIDTQEVDLILTAEEMFEEISTYCENSHLIASRNPKKTNIEGIFELLEKRSGTDFSRYKPSTIMRRINHRINLLNLKSLEQYHNFINKQPNELNTLFNTVLIGVTEFFRDKTAFQNLEIQLKELLKEKKNGEAIRIWSVGCATGEEAYSICIILDEILGKNFKNYNIQMFASDIDEQAINYARKGIYEKESLRNISADRLNKYFNQVEESKFEINKEIKRYILFTKHDITTDPPFMKLDLITCRNLFIYFNNSLQKQTLQVFHYSLKPWGLLFLGKSESVSGFTDLFNKINDFRIFRKSDSPVSYKVRFSQYNRVKPGTFKKDIKPKESNSLLDIAKETLFLQFQFPFVIVNEHAEIHEAHGSLRLYLEIQEGSINTNLFKMVNKEMTTLVKALHSQAKRTAKPQESPVMKFKLYDVLHHVKIKIFPLSQLKHKGNFYLVIFEKVVPSKYSTQIQEKFESINFTDLKIKELQDELKVSQEHLQIFTEELETTNEELQHINEELQSSVEELRSTNEELETSNEELQSANEELQTANNELRIINETLIQKENELKRQKAISEKNELIYRKIAENIPNGTVGILNSKFEIQYLAGKGLEKFNINPKDIIGENLPSLNPSKKERERLIEIFNKTLNGKNGNIEFSYGENYYNLHTTPLPLENNSHNIMYLTQNVTEQRKRELKLNMAIKAADLLIYDWSATSNTFEKNPALNAFLGYDKKITLTGEMYMDRIHLEDQPQIIKIWEKAQKTGTLEYEARMIIGNTTKWIRVLGKILYDELYRPERVLAVLINITKDKKLLQHLQASEEKFKEISDSAPVMIWLADTEKRCTYLNSRWYTFTGGTPKAHLGDGWISAIHPEDRPDVMDIYSTSFDKKKKFSIEYRIRRHDGEYCWFLIHGQPIMQGEDYFEGFIGSCIDISEQKEFRNKLEDLVSQRTKELEKSNAELLKVNVNLEEYAYVASHDLQEPIRKIRTFNSIIQDNVTDTESLDYCSKIEQSAKHMTSLVQNILDYSRLSESSFKKEYLDLNDIMGYITDDLELIITDKKAKIRYGDLGKVLGIEIQLHQLFGNIIINSLKFNEGIPHIDITSKLVPGQTLKKQFQADTTKEYTMVAIADDGIGINQEFIDQIFKPFKRLNPKNKYSGTGIGLSISLRIAELHQGFISVDSKGNSGTTFKVFLPTS